jgi:hypothetical protein
MNAVPSGALNDEHVGACLFRLPCLLGARDRHPNLRAARAQPLDQAGGGTSERERDHLNGGRRRQQLELRRPVVVVPARLANGDIRPPRPGAKALDVSVILGRVGSRSGHEQVDPERAGSQLSRRAKPRVDINRLEIRGGHEAEPSGVAHRGRKLGREGAASEWSENHWTAKLVKNHR